MRHRRHLLESPLPAETSARYARMAVESLAAQRQIEAADTVPFEVYRQQYLSQDLLAGVHPRSGS
jgi:glutamate--cysteine ligase